MNERIKQLVEQSQKVVGYLDGGYTEIKALDQVRNTYILLQRLKTSLELNDER